MKVKSKSEVAQLCPTPSDCMDCSLPGSSIHGIFQATSALLTTPKPLTVWITTNCGRFFNITGWGIDLDYRDTEWFALEMNRDHSVVLRLQPSTADSFVDYDGYSISSERFLPTVVDIMVI